MLTHELRLHDVIMVDAQCAVIAIVITGSIFLMTVSKH